MSEECLQTISDLKSKGYEVTLRPGKFMGAGRCFVRIYKYGEEKDWNSFVHKYEPAIETFGCAFGMTKEEAFWSAYERWLLREAETL